MSRMTSASSAFSAREDERGSIMIMAAIFIVAIVIGAWGLIDAGQELTARRDAFATASAAARAAAQGSDQLLRAGNSSIDLGQGCAAAADVVSQSGFTLAACGPGRDARSVTVRVTVRVNYAFPPPGLPASVTGSATAVSHRGVSGTEGG